MTDPVNPTPAIASPSDIEEMRAGLEGVKRTISEASMVCHQSGYHDLGESLDGNVAAAVSRLLAAYDARGEEIAEARKIYEEQVTRAENQWKHWERRALAAEKQLAEAKARIGEAVAAEREALDGIYTYCNDTLSGRADGGVDDRAWQREAVIKARDLARPFARPAIEAAIRAQAGEQP